MLPSDVAKQTTEQVGFFQYGISELAEWLLAGLNSHAELNGHWSLHRPNWATADEAYAALVPKDLSSTYAWTPIGDRWSVLMTDGPLGTDPSLLPSHAAQELGCRAIRATCSAGIYPARILTVYGPAGEPMFRRERSIAAANDGGRWVFETSGEPFWFEDQEAYARRIKSKRFTEEMLYEYLGHLGVPFDVEPSWSDAVIVKRVQ